MRIPESGAFPTLGGTLVDFRIPGDRGSKWSFSVYGFRLPVRVNGRLHFPAERWTKVKDGLEIMGGGLRFHDDRVFLMAGTLFRTP